MKTSLYPHKNPVHRQRGFLEVDLVVATAILALAILPVGFAFTHERRVLRAEYDRSVAVELVDGEAEILAAGAGRDFRMAHKNILCTRRRRRVCRPERFNLPKPAVMRGWNGLRPSGWALAW